MPLLGDIPLIGRAFQNRAKSSVRTELLLLITPYVLEDATQVEEVTRAVRERFGRVERNWPGRPDGAPAPLRPEPLPVLPAKPDTSLPSATQLPAEAPIEGQVPAAVPQAGSSSGRPA